MGTLSRHPHYLGALRRRSHRGSKPVVRSHVAHWPEQTHAPVGNRVPEALSELGHLGELEAASRPASAFNIPLNTLNWSDPFHWLALGFRDFTRAPVLGLFYGTCFVVMGWLLMVVFQQAPAYTMALSAGFLLVGPFMCLGLYEVSQDLSQGRVPRFGASLQAWRTRSGQMAIFGGVLLILEMLWGRVAMIVFILSFEGIPDFQGSLFKLLNPENLSFIVAYLAVGAFFAGLIYSISVISIPMMLDRQVDAITAGLTSLRLVTSQPGVMLLWGALITLLVCVAMAPGFLGLLLVGPLVGHASWHAYKASVGPMPKRP